MDLELENLISRFQKREISKDTFVSLLPIELGENPEYLKKIFLDIIERKDSKQLQNALTILWLINKEKEQIDVLNQLLLEDWHTRYEDIIHEIQKQKNPKSIPYIEAAMQNKYDYLISYGTGVRQFINQCGHALKSIGTDDAISVIYEFSDSENLILRDEMLYRISSMTESNNHERNYDLDDSV